MIDCSCAGAKSIQRHAACRCALPSDCAMGKYCSTLRHQIVDVSGLDEFRRPISDSQRLEMSLATLYLCALLVAQILGKQAALSFDHEVESFLAVLFHQDGPVRVIGA